MIRDIVLVMLGAAIVCIGQLAQALVERVRYGKQERGTRRARARASDQDPVPRDALPSPRGGEERSAAERNRKDARSGLTGLGFNGRVAHLAVAEASAKLGELADVEALMREALRVAPKVERQERVS